MKRIILLIICLFISLQPVQGMSLDQAVEKGIRISGDIKNNSLESKILEIDNRLKKLEKRFTLTGSGSWLYKSEKTEIEMPEIELAPGMSISDLKLSGGVYHNFDFKVSLTQPIFTGYALSGQVRINEIRQSLNITTRELLELMLRGRIKSIFFNHRMLASQKNSLLALERKIRNHMRRLDDLFGEDLVGKSQVLETRLKHREILLSIEEAENSLNRIGSTFMQLTGTEIKDIDTEYRENVGNAQSSMDRFVRNHPRLRILSRKEEMIHVNKKITTGRNLPRVAGFAELHYGVPGVNFISDRWMAYFQGGLEVKLNVFNWGKSRQEYRISNYNLEKIDNEKKELIRKTGLQLEELFATLKSLKKRSGTFDEMVKIAVEESEMKRLMFDEKQISNREYIDSMLNVENLRSLKEKTDLQSELTKVEINTLAGIKEEK